MVKKVLNSAFQIAYFFVEILIFLFLALVIYVTIIVQIKHPDIEDMSALELERTEVGIRACLRVTPKSRGLWAQNSSLVADFGYGDTKIVLTRAPRKSLHHKGMFFQERYDAFAKGACA